MGRAKGRHRAIGQEMTVFKGSAWRNADNETLSPPRREDAMPQAGKTLEQVRQELRSAGLTLLGTGPGTSAAPQHTRTALQPARQQMGQTANVCCR